MQLPLTLTLHPSRRLAAVLLVAHLWAMATLAAIAVPFPLRTISLLLIAWSAWRSLRGIYGRARMTRLVLKAEGKLEYFRLDGRSGEATAGTNSTVMPQLTVLLLRGTAEGPISVVLLSDSLGAENFRQLRLWLRWRTALLAVG